MKTHQHAALLLFCLLSFQWLSAQQVYQAHHYGSPGDIYLYNRFAPGLLNDEITKDGAGITWDLSTQAGLGTHVNQIFEPGEAINQFNFLTICSLGGLSTLECLDVWNRTDQAVQLKDSLLLLDFILQDLQRYQTKENSLLLENFIGFTVDIGGSETQAVIVYQNQDTILHFPVQYGDAWTSSTSYGLDLNPAGQNIIYHSTQSRITTIDGWGTLQTPYDTFENVIRLRSEILRLDTIVQDNTDTTRLIADQIEYMWLDTNYALPVMTANGLITSNDSVILTAVEYIYESSCQLPTWSVDAGGAIFFLDESGIATINFDIVDQNAQNFTWDFGDGAFGTSTGNTSHTYDSPGSYSVAVQGCMAHCLPLNSCSLQFINFEIIDSTTAVTNVDGKNLGINLFPNPATDNLTIFIPSELDAQSFRIIDFTGRVIRSGELNTGNTNLDIRELANGMYTFQLRSISKPGSTIAFTRFMKSGL